MLIKYTLEDKFNLQKTMLSGQCFHFIQLDTNKFRVFGNQRIVEISQVGNVLYLNCSENEFRSYWFFYLALDKSYSVLHMYLQDWAIERTDTFALESLQQADGIRILRQPLFETCCSYILSQRNNIPRIQNMVFGLSEQFGTELAEGKVFPTLAQLNTVSLQQFKDLGFGYRAEYIEGFVKMYSDIQFKTTDALIATRTRNCTYELDASTSLECNLATLKQVRGIGDKVANCIALFGLQEVSAFPVDVWMQKILDEDYKGKVFEKPEKFAGVLQQYMFYTKRVQANKNRFV